MESPINMECEFYQEIKLPCTLPDSINTTIIGKVLGINIKQEALTDGMIDISKIKPLARLGYNQYTAVDNVFTMNRPVELETP